MLNPYLESKRKIFDEVVAAFSAPIAPEPHEEPIRADPEELDKAVEFFHATLQKYGQQVVQRIGQVRGTRALHGSNRGARRARRRTLSRRPTRTSTSYQSV